MYHFVQYVTDAFSYRDAAPFTKTHRLYTYLIPSKDTEQTDVHEEKKNTHLQDYHNKNMHDLRFMLFM